MPLPHHAGAPSTSQPTAHRGSVAVLNRDLFFGVRIANTLRSQGYAVQIVPSIDRLAAFLDETKPETAEAEAAAAAPVLAIIDMTAVADWSAVGQLAADPGRTTPILAFGPHKDVAAFRSAKAAGVDRVVSNGDFHRDLLGLVERYAREP